MIYFLFIVALLIWIFFEDVNSEIKINPILFLILRVNEKNQKKLYEVLKEKFENEDIQSR